MITTIFRRGPHILRGVTAARSHFVSPAAAPLPARCRRRPRATPPPAATSDSNHTSTSSSSSSSSSTSDSASYGEAEYLASQQSPQRAAWAATRKEAQRKQQRGAGAGAGAGSNEFGLLDPPPALANVSVVLVGVLRPRTAGTVARLLAAFEAPTLHLVAPRCDFLGRPALSASKGAQPVLRAARVHATLEGALDGAVGVAFARWDSGGGGGGGGGGDGSGSGSGSGKGGPRQLRGVGELARSPEVVAALQRPGGQSRGGDGGGARPRLALVFGREEFGLADAEVRACALACALPMGRLVESLSLSHAAAIALSALYCAATEAGAAAEAGAGAPSSGGRGG